MKKLIALTTLVVLAFATSVPAQEPGGEKKFDMKEAMKKVQKLLEESESLIVKTLRKRGDPEAAAESIKKAREAIDELLKKGSDNGSEAVRMMTEILRNAPQGKGQGESQMKEDPKKSEQEKNKGKEERTDQRDPGNSGKPDGQRNPTDPRAKKDKPPASKTEKPRPVDPNQEWLATLPEKSRQKYLNGEWDEIPQPWRKLIEEYHKSLSEAESSRDRD